MLNFQNYSYFYFAVYLVVFITPVNCKTHLVVSIFVVRFLGHIISAEQNRPDTQEVKLNYTPFGYPEKKTRSILDIANYLREIIPNMAELISLFKD